MSEQQTYHGSCHCGAIRYEARSAPIAEAMSCNCSYCRRFGGLLAFIPAQNFKLESGEDRIADYQFGQKVIHHLFCRTCGIGSFGRGTMPDGTEMVALNVRCIEEIDPDTLAITPFDGKSL
ncbi:GFA family protein [Hyphomicrobium sp. CS1GBMeth3]|uniref:GFA family protein n=1 Tax=Hyphomicrobium sp. CS1GBMeth3 TaxID=1892845 RepID=UPI000931B1A3|nr:GFA family protein [Hyphomicrobium sp. CS1GBMeth3]